MKFCRHVFFSKHMCLQCYLVFLHQHINVLVPLLLCICSLLWVMYALPVITEYTAFFLLLSIDSSGSIIIIAHFLVASLLLSNASSCQWL